MCLWWSVLSCCLCCCSGGSKLLSRVFVVVCLLSPLLIAQLLYIGCHSSHNIQLIHNQENITTTDNNNNIQSDKTQTYPFSYSDVGDGGDGVWVSTLRFLTAKWTGGGVDSFSSSSSSSSRFSDTSFTPIFTDKSPCPVLPVYLHWQFIFYHLPSLRLSVEPSAAWIYQNTIDLLPGEAARPLALSAVALTLYLQSLLLLVLVVYVSWRLVLAPLVQLCWWLLWLAVVVVGLFKLLRLSFLIYGAELLADESSQAVFRDVFDNINHTIDWLLFSLVNHGCWQQMLAALPSVWSMVLGGDNTSPITAMLQTQHDEL
eukprot:GHVS01005803.1.p1 GENE.GHVS01005803.1~~GHVS01005803.1.p1  ORF type:complete len:315 (-),score=80.89 GHVS01005803.1:488-1432(-)